MCSANIQQDSIATQPLLKISTISSATSQHSGINNNNGVGKLMSDPFDSHATARRLSRPAVLDVTMAGGVLGVGGATAAVECPPPLPAKERKADNHYIKNKSMQSPTAGKNRVSV